MLNEIQTLLLRRQLLRMESKRIQTLLDHAEDEVKVEQQHRFALRSSLAALTAPGTPEPSPETPQPIA
jgi:hypothetical protein